MIRSLTLNRLYLKLKHVTIKFQSLSQSFCLDCICSVGLPAAARTYDLNQYALTEV